MSSKTQPKSEDTAVGSIFQQVSWWEVGSSSYLRKGYKGLEHHFKSIIDYSLMVAQPVLTTGEELLGKFAKKETVMDSFLGLKLGFSFQNKWPEK